MEIPLGARHHAVARLGVALLAVAGLTLAACSSGTSAKAPGGGDLIKFTSAIFPGDTYVLDYVAQKKGFFTDHGLDVSYLMPASGSAAVQLLAAGQVQGWTTAPSVVYGAAEQGQPIAVAGMIKSLAPYNLIVKNNASWADANAPLDQRLKSLSGKTIGVSGLGAGTDLALRAALSSAHVPESSVNRIGVGTTLAGLGQLQGGVIDGYVEFTGSGTKLIESKLPGRIYIDLVGKDQPLPVQTLADLAVAVNTTWAKANPKGMADWLAALQQADDWVKDPANLNEAAQIVSEASYKGQYLDEVKSALGGLVGKLKDSSGFTVTRPRVDAQLSILHSLGVLKTDKVTFDSVVLPSAQG